MSVEADLRAEFDRWERRETAVLGGLPYVLLAISVVITLLQLIWRVPVHLPAVLALSIATALWLLWFHTLHPEWHSDRPLMGLYYTGLMVLATGLVSLAPWFGFFCFVGYPQAFYYLTGRWRYVGVAATAMVSAAAWLGGVASIIAGNLWWAWLGVGTVTMLLAGAFSYFADMSDHRNDKQKQALAELEQANIKLRGALAENAGLHAQLVVQAREAGVLDERQRMATEIHDTLAQGLAGILTQLQALEQTVGDPQMSGQHLSNATSLARESLAEARRTVQAVEPAMLADQTRLPDAIDDMARRWSELNQIDTKLTTTGAALPLQAELEVTLLRAAQEALANVAKHARADRVGLTLSYMEDLVSLDVRDGGVGFDSTAARTNDFANGGFGLPGMRQRIQRLAGRLDIESELGAGTAISATVPAIPAGGED